MAPHGEFGGSGGRPPGGDRSYGTPVPPPTPHPRRMPLPARRPQPIPPPPQPRYQRGGGLLGVLLGAATAGAAASALRAPQPPTPASMPVYQAPVQTPPAGVICPNCGGVASGNFCEICGAKL